MPTTRIPYGVLDGRYVNTKGDSVLGNLDFADEKKITIDEIQARDADGLKLYDDDGNGIFIEDGGQVGIGTTTPSQILDVIGHIVTEGCVLPAWLTKGAIGAYNPDGSGSEGTGFYINIPAQGTAYGGFALGYGSTCKWLYGMSRGIADATALVFYEDASAAKCRMLIATGGKVGIQTGAYRAPGRILDVLDASYPQLRLTHTSGSIYTDFQTVSDGYLYINPSGGRVGIGISSPAYALEVDGQVNLTAGNYFRAEDGESVSRGIMSVDTDANTLLNIPAGKGFRFIVAGGVSEVVRILGTGNVGIGTTGPDRKLDILDDTSPQLRLTHIDGSVYADFQTTSDGNIIITPTGYVVLASNKDTTGDPTGIEGMIYINTADSVIKMYADAGWRTLASW